MPHGGNQPAPPRQRSRRIWLYLSVAIVAVAALIAVLIGSGSSSPLRINDVSAMPAAYQIVYRVDESNGGAVKEAWEVFTQTDPFGASDLTYHSDPRSGASPVTGTVSSFDHLYDLAGGLLTLVSARQPGPGSGIQALGVELAELKARGLAHAIGRSAVAGESCTVFRLAEPPVGPIAAPNGSGHDDMCINRSGLVLREDWTYQGALVLQRSAVEERVGTADPAVTGPPSELSAREAQVPTLLRLLQPTAQSFLANPPAPAGFAAPPAVATVAYSPSDPTQVTDTSMIWSFVSDGKLITVEAGQGTVPWAPAGTPTQTLALGGLGAATSALRSDGPEIRVQLGGARWVRVRGTVPLEVLAAYASGLKLAGR
ncbi:MAG TPA: hypothetical protein VMO88_01495 [Acidimicrobiales bacterium]|nr:hypothetical protein [Acidimicrobiales bacterium]